MLLVEAFDRMPPTGRDVVQNVTVSHGQHGAGLARVGCEHEHETVRALRSPEVLSIVACV